MGTKDIKYMTSILTKFMSQEMLNSLNMNCLTVLPMSQSTLESGSNSPLDLNIDHDNPPVDPTTQTLPHLSLCNIIY